jgi:CheY-like chemotaxis protein
MNSLKPILLVEDSRKDVELTLAALEESQVANKVVVLHDGAQAVSYLRTCVEGKSQDGLPVVILLDIKMPKVSGTEVLKFIKTDPQFNQIPVVMLTSSREGPDIDACYRLGVNAYVVKPVDFDGFFKAIKDVGRFWAVVNQPPTLPETIAAGEVVGAGTAGAKNVPGK